MIKAIIFDCFGVLTSSTWKEFWSSLPTTKQQEGARELNRLYDAGNISKDDFLNRIKALTNRSQDQVEYALFGRAELKNSRLIDYIKGLKKEYKISILSNIATNWVKDELLSKDEQALFDDMVFSFAVGMTKPDPEIFKLAAKRLGLEVSECVLIDDIQRYCDVAKALGMQAVVYKDFKQMKDELESLLANA